MWYYFSGGVIVGLVPHRQAGQHRHVQGRQGGLHNLREGLPPFTTGEASNTPPRPPYRAPGEHQ